MDIFSLTRLSWSNFGATWEWVVNATSQSLYPGEKDPVPIVQEAKWGLGPVWMGAENLAQPSFLIL